MKRTTVEQKCSIPLANDVEDSDTILNNAMPQHNLSTVVQYADGEENNDGSVTHPIVPITMSPKKKYIVYEATYYLINGKC